MSLYGMGPSLAVDGSIDGEVFEAYVERVLAPTLRVGQVAVLDNLSAHKGERVRKLIEHRGWDFLYLPPYYSPDLNPIEEALGKIKGFLRKAEARTRAALVEAMGQALPAVSGHDARGFFNHCGYRPLAQLL
jgi:transposase